MALLDSPALVLPLVLLVPSAKSNGSGTRDTLSLPSCSFRLSSRHPSSAHAKSHPQPTRLLSGVSVLPLLLNLD